ncbi:hypothetical protein MSG28_007330 [Choristoneura fumiferana]|uniref:Uncharacterized protein n=1 Tax=Choristoneura fumiferana TaxID=7141 RepID=A0ACC0JWK3_CHOFU|nr:hypothetical protein MSG28_007330 [Choristoneura fumiferana]
MPLPIEALTDDEARRNWEKYGNPDGPGAMSFGIALPSWIVEKENSVWVLGLYALVFMVALPTVVGTWWYRSIRYSGEQVLLDTTQMYFYFCHKTPSMPLKRALMILAASCEFDRRHNSEVIERITDNEEVPMLLRDLPNLGEKNKEQPLCRPYSIKARALLHAHLSRMRLPSEALDADRRYVVSRCPDLIVEMVNCVNQLIALAYARRIPRLPTIETIENCMKMSPMIVQGLWEYKSPLLQLPYITEDHLKYFTNRKKHIKSLLQLAQLPGEERRQVMRFLNDKQYDDVMKVLGNMPYIHFQSSGSRDSGSEESRKSSGAEDDDDQWDKFQKRLQKRERLEGRSKSSHPVHCPYFPQVDSYIGMDQQQDMKLDVKEAAAVPADHPQWDLSESDTDNNDQGGNESEFTTDDEVEEE